MHPPFVAVFARTFKMTHGNKIFLFSRWLALCFWNLQAILSQNRALLPVVRQKSLFWGSIFRCKQMVCRWTKWLANQLHSDHTEKKFWTMHSSTNWISWSNSLLNRTGPCIFVVKQRTPKTKCGLYGTNFWTFAGLLVSRSSETS